MTLQHYIITVALKVVRIPGHPMEGPHSGLEGPHSGLEGPHFRLEGPQLGWAIFTAMDVATPPIT